MDTDLLITDLYPFFHSTPLICKVAFTYDSHLKIYGHVQRFQTASMPVLQF